MINNIENENDAYLSFYCFVFYSFNNEQKNIKKMYVIYLLFLALF